MADKRPLTPQEVDSKFQRALRLLRDACDDYDNRSDDYFVKIANDVRLLFHNTWSSVSLIKQMGLLDGKFISTSYEFDPKNLISHSGLLLTRIREGEVRHFAPLDDTPIPSRLLPLEEWWAEVVLASPGGPCFSRKNLILVACNQDGGSHVDPEIDVRYSDLLSGEFLNWTKVENGKQSLMTGAERESIRQIGHEVLKSLLPGYEKRPENPSGDMQMNVSQTSFFTGKDAQAEALKRGFPVSVPRNQTCPCGSGLRFKRCHGRLV